MPCPGTDSSMAVPGSQQIPGNIFATLIAVVTLFVARIIYRKTWKTRAKINVVVLGGGPIGVTVALVAANSNRVRKLTIVESDNMSQIIKREYQVCFDKESVKFLETLGVDFDNMEGCHDNNGFYTRVGIYLEFCLSLLENSDMKICLEFGKKFDKGMRKCLEKENGRTLVIVCDGKKGQSAKVLGLEDFTEDVSCMTFGAMAGIERPHQREVPTQEIRAHNLNFDLSAYGTYNQDINGIPGFSLKIFGNSKYRYISLAIKRCDSPVIKTLRTILDRSMMRNIFLKCFNTYKLKEEPNLSDSFALNHMKFSPRLFEVQYSQRCETVAYFDDCDMFVLLEGEAAISCNFHTGMDINQGIRGLHSLEQFITMVTWAETEQSISAALAFKMQHSSEIFNKLSRNGMKEFMFS